MDTAEARGQGTLCTTLPCREQIGKGGGQKAPDGSLAGMSSVWDVEWIGVLPEARCKGICKHGYRDLEITYGCLQAL